MRANWGNMDGSRPLGFELVHAEGKRMLRKLLDIEVPVIGAVNGPASIHAELACLSDITLASDNATFADSAHTPISSLIVRQKALNTLSASMQLRISWRSFRF